MRTATTQHRMHTRTCRVHSPGPAAYSPDTSPTRVAAAEYSLGKKAASYFDLYLDPQRQLSPGPMYTPKVK